MERSQSLLFIPILLLFLLWLYPRPTSRLLKATHPIYHADSLLKRDTQNSRMKSFLRPCHLPTKWSSPEQEVAADLCSLMNQPAGGWPSPTSNILSCPVLKRGLSTLLPPPTGPQNATKPPLEAEWGRGQRRGPRCLDLMVLSMAPPLFPHPHPWICVCLAWPCPPMSWEDNPSVILILPPKTPVIWQRSRNLNENVNTTKKNNMIFMLLKTLSFPVKYKLSEVKKPCPFLFML